MKWTLVIATLMLVSLVLVNSTLMKFTSCTDNEDLENLPCTIDKVEIDGCKNEPSAPTNCKLKRGENGSIVIDYTPGFDADNVTAHLYSTRPRDVAWPGMDTNACSYTKCPLVKDQPAQYNLTMSISRSYPRSLFSVRYLMKENNIPRCCFLMKISTY